MKVRLETAFFARSARDVAHDLVGTRIVHVVDGTRREGTVVETEAYLGPDDRACHARFGRTKAREHLFGAPGTAYVFLVYGMHHCFNVTCLAEGAGHAVLLRGVELESEPTRGGRGPGKLARALGLDLRHGGLDVTSSRALFFERTDARLGAREVAVSARIGIDYAGEDARLPLRFFDPTSDAVSRPRAPRASAPAPRSVRERGRT